MGEWQAAREEEPPMSVLQAVLGPAPAGGPAQLTTPADTGTQDGPPGGAEHPRKWTQVASNVPMFNLYVTAWDVHFGDIS